jgi:hypothetical protein
VPRAFLADSSPRQATGVAHHDASDRHDDRCRPSESRSPWGPGRRVRRPGSHGGRARRTRDPSQCVPGLRINRDAESRCSVAIQVARNLTPLTRSGPGPASPNATMYSRQAQKCIDASAMMKPRNASIARHHGLSGPAQLHRCIQIPGKPDITFQMPRPSRRAYTGYRGRKPGPAAGGGRQDRA